MSGSVGGEEPNVGAGVEGLWEMESRETELELGESLTELRGESGVG